MNKEIRQPGIATKINNLLIKKGDLEKVEDMVLVSNTDDIFSDFILNSLEDIHFPAQAASVAHRIAFGPIVVLPEQWSAGDLPVLGRKIAE